MSDLTVLTVVENDKGIFDLMLKSVRKFTNPVPQFIVCYNGGDKSFVEKYSTYPDVTVVWNTPTMSGGSNRHGEGLNKIVPMVSTDRAAIVESDCIVLREGWDEIKPGFDIVAAEKGKALYHICFVVFKTAALRNLDFRPGTSGNRGNRPYKAREDVGWRINQIVPENRVLVADFVDCKTGKGKYFNSSFQSDEFWVEGNPTVAHFGRGSNIGGKAVRKGFRHPQEQLVEWKKIAEGIVL